MGMLGMAGSKLVVVEKNRLPKRSFISSSSLRQRRSKTNLALFIVESITSGPILHVLSLTRS